MRDKRSGNLVEDIASRISESLGGSGGDARYSCTSMGSSGPGASDISGTWKVVSHEVAGTPYETVFAQSALRNAVLDNVDYDATYEFVGSSCVKRVRIRALADGEPYEYRLAVTLSWRFSGGTMTAHPLSGYQYASIGGTVYPVGEIETSRAPVRVGMTFAEGTIVLRDGSDVKTLRRTDR